MRGVIATLAAALVLLVPAGAAASGGGAPTGRAPILGIVPHAGAPQSLGSAQALGALGVLGAAPQGGPLALQTQPCSLANDCWVMRTNTVYAIYWIPSGSTACAGSPCHVDANYESDIDQYFTDVAAASGRTDNVYSVATQYYDATGPISYSSSFAGSYVDTDPFPTNGCNVGAGVVCLTDQQIENEIQNVLTTKGWHGSTTTIFFLMTPDGVASCADGTSSQCSTNVFCAYHSGFTDSNDEPVIYANEPYDATTPDCWDGTSPHGDDADATINTISHEHNEAITDPWGDAWLDPSQNEIGDICAWDFGPPIQGIVGGNAYNQVINGDHYWLQQEYSNDGNICRQQYLGIPVNLASPTASGIAVQGKLLTATQGTWTQSPKSFAYQWLRCAANGTGCVAIPGATEASYDLAAADGGHTLEASVSATNAAGTRAATSNRTGVVIGVPAAAEAPRISGVPRVGRRLTADHGSWSGPATSYGYQWLRCDAHGGSCRPIGGATRQRYKVTQHDAGHRLRLLVTAANVAGSTVAKSRATASVPVRRKH
jgi:hypothetical protein